MSEEKKHVHNLVWFWGETRRALKVFFCRLVRAARSDPSRVPRSANLNRADPMDSTIQTCGAILDTPYPVPFSKKDRLAFRCAKVGQGPMGHIFVGCSYFWMRSRTFKTTPPIIRDPPVTSHSIHDAKGSSILIVPPYSIGFNPVRAIADLNRHGHIQILLQPSHIN